MTGQQAPDDGVFVVHDADGVVSIHQYLRDAVAASDTWEQIGFLPWGEPAQRDGIESITPEAHR